MTALLFAALVLADTHFVSNHFVDPTIPEETVLKFNCELASPYRDPEAYAVWFYHANEQAVDWSVLEKKRTDDCSISLRTTDWPGGQHFLLVEHRSRDGALIASGAAGFWIHTAQTPAPVLSPGERPARPTFTVQP